MHPTWHAVFALLAAALVGLAAAPNGRCRSSPAGRSLEVTLTTPAATVGAGEPIVMTLSVTSRARKPVDLRFRSGQRYDFAIRDGKGKVLWRWSDGRVFTQALGAETIAPGTTLSWQETFPETLDAGSYELIGTIPVVRSELTATSSIEVK